MSSVLIKIFEWTLCIPQCVDWEWGEVLKDYSSLIHGHEGQPHIEKGKRQLQQVHIYLVNKRDLATTIKPC